MPWSVSGSMVACFVLRNVFALMAVGQILSDIWDSHLVKAVSFISHKPPGCQGSLPNSCTSQSSVEVWETKDGKFSHARCSNT